MRDGKGDPRIEAAVGRVEPKLEEMSREDFIRTYRELFGVDPPISTLIRRYGG